jgi:predicted  nucleic acid-binding Zn-ribbon protein
MASDSDVQTRIAAIEAALATKEAEMRTLQNQLSAARTRLSESSNLSDAGKAAKETAAGM